MKKGITGQLDNLKHLKTHLNASIFIFLLFFAIPAHGQLLEDNFDTYDYGLLHITGATGGWYLPAGASTSASVVQNTFFKSFPNSIYLTSEFNNNTDRTLPAMATGTLSFWFKAVLDSEIHGETISIFLKESGSVKLWLRFACGGGNCGAWPAEVQTNVEGTWYTIGSFATSTDWHFLNVDFSTSTANYTLDNGTPSGWKKIYASFMGGVKTITLFGGGQTGKIRLWLDNFGGYYSGISCGENALCGNCFSITACENAGCYWLNDTCFWFPTSPASDFLGYYASNSSFATPTTLVLNWVDFAKPFIETLGNWTSAFQENFNVASATESGLALGLVIPQAKGYVKFIDDFLGGLPLGELLTACLTILLLIIVFRIIKTIAGLLKP